MHPVETNQVHSPHRPMRSLMSSSVMRSDSWSVKPWCLARTGSILSRAGFARGGVSDCILWWGPMCGRRNGINEVCSDGCGRRSGVGARGGGMRMAARPRAGRTVAEGRPESEWAGWGGGRRSSSSRNCYSMGDWEAADGGDGGAVGGVGAAAQGWGGCRARRVGGE